MEKETVPKKLTIGVLAKFANVGVETVRFYERKGIIKQPSKVSSFRVYPQEDIKKIRFVKKMQELGFGLEEIKDFLRLTESFDETTHIVKLKSENKIQEIKQKISDLNKVLKALDRFAACCGTDKDPAENCELLECFENDWECCVPRDSDEEKNYE